MLAKDKAGAAKQHNDHHGHPHLAADGALGLLHGGDDGHVNHQHGPQQRPAAEQPQDGVVGPAPQVVAGDEHQAAQQNGAGKEHHSPHLVFLADGLGGKVVVLAGLPPAAGFRGGSLFGGRGRWGPFGRRLLLGRCLFLRGQTYSLRSQAKSTPAAGSFTGAGR